MGAFGFIGMGAILNTAILLAGCYFVLFVNRKVNEKVLKNFGYGVAGFLCLAALVMFISGIYVSLKSHERSPMMMQDMMRSQMQQPMQQPMMRR